ncbi:MAG: N-acetylglucosaminyl-diphospho-decaprenol L-rhamnosyltransferase [candidate division WS2 bacterium]|uniref:N-acetylglucosaminyl-diphospho-decaprenol L-rhamnosyltransferase n=1 Tax=Psychracetigena formicireducens TaxID=2986056 RepID=A0A9E2F7T0_PSYF1|nr:N-acetylglucosaminyl-diphospho-decaprenol L-rhamnosyltransferase [Candidatus Psychracetigena formicireducens]
MECGDLTLIISISIVNWNTKGLLRDCLKSIYENTHGIDYEIFVVDNASEDGSTKMVEKEFPKVKLIKNKENAGFAKANNQAIMRSKGRYVLLLNSDTVVLENALEKMMVFMDEHPGVGVLGPKILNPDGSLQPSCRSFPTLLTTFFEETLLNRLFPKNRIVGKYKMSYWEHNSVREIDQPMGSALMVRREAIEQVGLLDEQFYMYYEEVDWCYRIKKRGWKIYFIPQAQVIHYGGTATNKNKSKSLVETYRSMYKFFRKHYGRLSVILLKSLVMIGLSLKIFILSVLHLADKKSRENTKSKLKAMLAVLVRNITL